MIVDVEIAIPPFQVEDDDIILAKALKKAKLDKQQIKDWRIKRKSIDARARKPIFRLKIVLSTQAIIPPEGESFAPIHFNVESKKVIIVGAGPAGYFAALRCIEQGMKPIIIERGKDVQARRRDLRAIQQEGVVNPDSNYCFGEGGAGTYSDGKLYTRSHKRGNIKDILQILVDHGAPPDILIDAHPHIGSNKLPQIITRIRESILAHGGEVLFGHKVTDFIFVNQQCIGVKVMHDGNVESEKFADAVILATGHSARGIFDLCHTHQIEMEAKPFALGVRIEHPQELIDDIQYNQRKREPNLPASSYRVACQVDTIGVFSFCMCPGGLIVPASTNPQELVVNGMSLSKRDSPFANSGVVVEVSLDYLNELGFTGTFGGIDFQRKYEQLFHSFGDGTQQAPAQRLTDFVDQKTTQREMKSSYIPGLVSAPVHELLPSFISSKIRMAMKEFDKKLRGYYTSEANVIGIESRTSSPVRIVRDATTLMSPSANGFFPCGEGAGFAGGILSAALDGKNVADAVNSFLG